MLALGPFVLACAWRDHTIDAGHDDLEKSDKLAIVLWTNVQSTNLRQTFECDISEFRYLEELHRL